MSDLCLFCGLDDTRCECPPPPPRRPDVVPLLDLVAEAAAFPRILGLGELIEGRRRGVL